MVDMHTNPCKSLQECRHGNLENLFNAHIIVSGVGGQALWGGQKFAQKVINPFESNYYPLINSSAELGPILLNYYQTQIDVLI